MWLSSLWMDEEGLTTIEYAVLLALVAIASITAWTTLGTNVSQSIEDFTVVDRLHTRADLIANGFNEERIFVELDPFLLYTTTEPQLTVSLWRDRSGRQYVYTFANNRLMGVEVAKSFPPNARIDYDPARGVILLGTY